MSRFQKIFLASTLVIVGFGVAKFLGQPVLPLQALDFHRAQAQAVPLATQTGDSSSGGSYAAGRVRLLPDTPTTHAGTPATNVTAAMPEPPALGSALAPVLAANDAAVVSAMPRTVDFVPIASSPIRDSAPPRAKLRNEAPRPVGVDPHSPVAIRRMPPARPEDADPYKVADVQTGAMNWSAPQLMNAGYSDAGQSPPAAITASYAAPSSSNEGGQVAPPPWPASEENAGPRTHIIVDGDSLEKLAGRYLSDPQRSREIYELNREVLSAPDLLPIGAELKMPERTASASWDHQGFQPNSANARSNREAGRDNRLPVRPASAPQEIIPRAQLAPPVMVQ